MSVRLLYFAWVRDRVGRSEEVVDLPDGVATIHTLVAWLKGRGEEYAHAFESDAVRAAVDHVHAAPDTSLAGVREVAFFPPMTGG